MAHVFTQLPFFSTPLYFLYVDESLCFVFIHANILFELQMLHITHLWAEGDPHALIGCGSLSDKPTATVISVGASPDRTTRWLHIRPHAYFLVRHLLYVAVNVGDQYKLQIMLSLHLRGNKLFHFQYTCTTIFLAYLHVVQITVTIYEQLKGKLCNV